MAVLLLYGIYIFLPVRNETGLISIDETTDDMRFPSNHCPASKEAVRQRREPQLPTRLISLIALFWSWMYADPMSQQSNTRCTLQSPGFIINPGSHYCK